MQKILVAIVETDVFGAKAYHCKCLNCKWTSKRKDREAQAVKLAKKHYCQDKLECRRISALSRTIANRVRG